MGNGYQKASYPTGDQEGQKVLKSEKDALRTPRDLKILRSLKDHENLIEIKAVTLPDYPDHISDLYIVTEYMNSTLYSTLRNKDLSLDHIKFFTY